MEGVGGWGWVGERGGARRDRVGGGGSVRWSEAKGGEGGKREGEKGPFCVLSSSHPSGGRRVGPF